LQKYSETIGLPVICTKDGKKLGIIKDVIFCPRAREVKAFLLEKKGGRIRDKIIMLEDVVHLGRDAAVVDDISCMVDLKTAEKEGSIKGRMELKGLKIYSRAGSDIGVVTDVLFDFNTGFIEGIEVSDGLLQDVIQGRNILPLIGKVEFSSENVLVDREAVEEMTSTGGGLKKKILGE